MSEIVGTLREIPVDQIDVSDRLRRTRDHEVEKISISMAEVGQLQPIQVRPQSGTYRLVTGAHRLAAAKSLRWETIAALVVEASDDAARLSEIDENLHRVDLSPFDQANFIEERRQVWARLHGDPKRGGDRRSKAQLEPLIREVRRKGFLAETADAFGLSRQTIKRALTRKAQILPDLWQAIGDTPAADNGALLDKVRKVPIGDQDTILQIIRERGCTVQHAVREATKQPETDPQQAQFEALTRAWSKASDGPRKRFETWRREQK